MKIILFIALLACAVAYRPKHHISVMESKFIQDYERDFKLGKVKAVPEEWFTQRIDHFNLQDNRTYQQLYFVNDEYWKVGGPIFLFIGAEGPASSGWVMSSAMHTYAKKFGAMCVMLEHRFYGKSQPFPESTTENLRYLSSRQSLADMSTFRNYINKKYNSPNSKWITFGGSYGGSLSGWARLKYPHAFAGAIADSGPVFAKLDFSEYNEVATQAILSSENGEECANYVKKGYEAIIALVKTPEGQAKLKSDFNFCEDVKSEKDQHKFIEDITDMFMGVIQYSSPNHPTSIESKICNYFNSKFTSDPYMMMLNFSKSNTGSECLSISYDAFINEMRNTSPSSSRSWVWQTCSEFGWYQASTSKNQVFGDYLPVEYSIQECVDIYGKEATQELMDETNAHYGGFDQRGSNVFWTNGGVDPWHAMSIIESDNQDVVYIPSASHCAPLYTESESDPESIKMARYLTEQHIAKYLAGNN